jgi:hypothetical protein
VAARRMEGEEAGEAEVVPLGDADAFPELVPHNPPPLLALPIPLALPEGPLPTALTVGPPPGVDVPGKLLQLPLPPQPAVPVAGPPLTDTLALREAIEEKVGGRTVPVGGPGVCVGRGGVGVAVAPVEVVVDTVEVVECVGDFVPLATVLLPSPPEEYEGEVVLVGDCDTDPLLVPPPPLLTVLTLDLDGGPEVGVGRAPLADPLALPPLPFAEAEGEEEALPPPAAREGEEDTDWLPPPDLDLLGELDREGEGETVVVGRGVREVEALRVPLPTLAVPPPPPS